MNMIIALRDYIGDYLDKKKSEFEYISDFRVIYQKIGLTDDSPGFISRCALAYRNAERKGLLMLVAEKFREEYPGEHLVFLVKRRLGLCLRSDLSAQEMADEIDRYIDNLKKYPAETKKD